jgi:hypothetical protein
MWQLLGKITIQLLLDRCFESYTNERSSRDGCEENSTGISIS